jgi:cap2 methyltransferase
MKRIVDENFGTDEYPEQTTKDQLKKSAEECGLEHWGQLKLLMSEIEFLTPFTDAARHSDNYSCVVIYAGAAPGIHIPILRDLFPKFRYILIDPSYSIIENGQYENIEVMKRKMDNKLAIELERRYSGRILFISDIRTPPRDEEDHIQHQLRIQTDMHSQRAWYKHLHPECSMFKFRLPWTTEIFESTTKYLEGNIHLQVYGPFFSHESRLIVGKGAASKKYDNTLYEKNMAYFNLNMRILQTIEGRNYDRMASKEIIEKYLSRQSRVDKNPATKYIQNYKRRGTMDEIVGGIFIGIYRHLDTLCKQHIPHISQKWSSHYYSSNGPSASPSH